MSYMTNYINLGENLGEIKTGLSKRLRRARLLTRMESFNVGPGLDPAATIRGLVPGGSYSFNVFARAGANEGHYVHVQAQFNHGGEYGVEYGRVITLFMGKTFHGADVALKAAAVIAKALGAV